MLLAARDKFGCDIVVNQRLGEDDNQEEDKWTMVALYGESVLHRAGQTEDDGLRDEDVRIDLGDGPVKVIEKELQERSNEAEKNGLSMYRIENLRNVVDENKSELRIGVGSEGPVRVLPMKLTPDTSKNPVKVRVQ